MPVLPMNNIVPSESAFVFAPVKTRQQKLLKNTQSKSLKNTPAKLPGDTQKTKLIIPKQKLDTNLNSVLNQIDQRDKKAAAKKAFLKKQLEAQTPAKDTLWNIYTGNPGLYAAEGDTIGFGNVPYLPDSLFNLKLQVHTEKSDQPYGIVGKVVSYPKQDWLLGILLIAWIIFASVKFGFSKYLNQLIGGLVNTSTANRLYRERSYKTMYGALRLNFLFYLVLPLSAFQIAHYFNVNLPGYHDFFFFMMLFCAINAYFFAKIFLDRVLGSIVMLKEEVEESMYNMQMYFKVLGVFLLPVVTIHTVVNEIQYVTVWIMAIIIVFFYLGSILRSIYIGNRKGISIFYLILYLCLLEILPLILIFKILTNE